MDGSVLETDSDRYVIDHFLTEGGMGAIYLGKKIGQSGRTTEVVLKQLLPEYTSDAKFIDLFLREARLSAALEHGNIVRTLDLVNAGTDYFIVMEYVNGADLRTLMRRARRRGQQFSPQAALFVGVSLLAALDYAHEKAGPDGKKLGLIHRDVSPSNVLVSENGTIKLTDFGIAKVRETDVFKIVKGKIGYMAPEQAKNDPVDGRADIFSVAVIVYELLSGERLFVGDANAPAVVYAQRVRPISTKREGIPTDLDTLLSRGLSIDPNGRFATAGQFRQAIIDTAAKLSWPLRIADFAGHIKVVCGEDTGAWKALDSFESEEPQGTAQMTVDEIEKELADDERPATRTNTKPLPPLSQPGRQLTSVLVKPEKNDDAQKAEQKDAPLKPRNDEPSAPRRVTLPRGAQPAPPKPGKGPAAAVSAPPKPAVPPVKAPPPAAPRASQDMAPPPPAPPQRAAGIAPPRPARPAEVPPPPVGEIDSRPRRKTPADSIFATSGGTGPGPAEGGSIFGSDKFRVADKLAADPAPALDEAASVLDELLDDGGQQTNPSFEANFPVLGEPEPPANPRGREVFMPPANETANFTAPTKLPSDPALKRPTHGSDPQLKRVPESTPIAQQPAVSNYIPPQVGMAALAVDSGAINLKDLSHFRMRGGWRSWATLVVALVMLAAAGTAVGIAVAGPDVELPSVPATEQR